MSKKIELSVNHTRSLSSSLIVIEKSLLELEEMILRNNNSCCNILVRDIDEVAVESTIAAIKEARGYICHLAEKYNATRENLSLQRVINAKRAAIWQILTDTLSKRMKGYGQFPKELMSEYDADINKLIEITNRINS